MFDTCKNCGAPLSIGTDSVEVEIDFLKEENERLRAELKICKKLLQSAIRTNGCREVMGSIDYEIAMNMVKE